MVTYGKLAFDASATPVSEDQQSAGPVLMFKAPEGTVFLADVAITLPVSKAIYSALYGSDDENAARRLLSPAPTQELKQFWFNEALKVTICNFMKNKLFVLIQCD